MVDMGWRMRHLFITTVKPDATQALPRAGSDIRYCKMPALYCRGTAKDEDT